MDNINEDRPSDANSHPPSGESPTEETQAASGREADVAPESEAGKQQPLAEGSETPTESSPDPASDSPEAAGPIEPTGPEPEWPPEDIGKPEEPRQSDIAIGRDDEHPPDSTSAAEPVAEDAAQPETMASPDSEANESGKAADQSPAKTDGKAMAAALEQQRHYVVKELFGKNRPRQAKAEEVIEAYSAAAHNAALADALEPDEATKVIQRVSGIHASAFNSEKSELEKTAAEVKRHVDTYNNLFVQLETLVDDAAGELASLDEEDEQFQNAPRELQAALLNSKKGIEIIHRMFVRTKDRKKELADELPGPLPDDWNAEVPPTASEDLGEFVRQLFRSFHKLRDANYHAIQDAKKSAEKCRKTAVDTVAGLLSAVDGIDAGLRNEPEMRAKLAPFEEGDNNCGALIDSWLQAYHRLDDSVVRFFSKTGIEAHSVDPGTPFDPETMEPQGTVTNPEMNDEDVAAVMRRGFSLNGEPVRPIVVEVVKNN